MAGVILLCAAVLTLQIFLALELNELRKVHAMSQQDIDQIAEELREVKANLAEASTEIVQRVSDLEDEIFALKEQIVNGQPADFTAALALLDEVKGQSKALADIVPNAEPPADDDVTPDVEETEEPSVEDVEDVEPETGA